MEVRRTLDLDIFKTTELQKNSPRTVSVFSEINTSGGTVFFCPQGYKNIYFWCENSFYFDFSTSTSSVFLDQMLPFDDTTF